MEIPTEILLAIIAGLGTFIAWVHVSYNKDKNRKQVLRALKVNGKTIYQPYTEKP